MNIIEIFQNYAEKNHFSFSTEKPDALEFMYISSDYRIGILRYEVQKNRLGYVMSVYLPIQVDGNSKDEMLKISELTAKINYDLRTTTETFELNWETGALRFKCMLEDSISESDAEELVKRACSVVNTYAEQFLSLIFGNVRKDVHSQNGELPDEEEISGLEYDSEIPKIPEENADFDLQRFLSDSDELEDSEIDFDEDDVPPDWGNFNEADLYVDDDTDSDDNDSYLDEDSYIDDSEDENSYTDNSEDDDEGDSDGDNVDIVL